MKNLLEIKKTIFGSASRPKWSKDTEAVVKKSGTSFYWAMRRLPANKRDAMYAIYAFCRLVDDIVDEPGNVGKKQEDLMWWRCELNQLYRGTPTHFVTQALLTPVSMFGGTGG